MAAAQKVNSDPKADQTKVNDANKALEKAIKDLKEQEKPDPEPTPELKAPVDVKFRKLPRQAQKHHGRTRRTEKKRQDTTYMLTV